MFAMEGSELFFPRNPVQTEIDKRVEKKNNVQRERQNIRPRSARLCPVQTAVRESGRVSPEWRRSNLDADVECLDMALWHYDVMALWVYAKA